MKLRRHRPLGQRMRCGISPSPYLFDQLIDLVRDEPNPTLPHADRTNSLNSRHAGHIGFTATINELVGESRHANADTRRGGFLAFNSCRHFQRSLDAARIRLFTEQILGK
jgi:hypothetical protein